MKKTKSNKPKKVTVTTQQPELYQSKGERLLDKGKIKLQEQNYLEVIELVNQVITQSTSQEILAEAFSLRAEANYQIDNFQLAVEDYTKALEYGFNKNLALLFAQRGHAFLILKKFKEAVKDLQKASELEPKEFNIMINLSVAYDCDGRQEDALNCYNKILEHSAEMTREDLGTVYTIRAQQYYDKKEFERAADDFENAIIHLSSIDKLTYQRLARSYLILKKDERAKNFSEEGFKRYPEIQILHIVYIQACFNLKDFQSAINHYRKHKSLISQYIVDIYNLGIGFLELKSFDNATEIFGDLVKIDTKNLSYQQKLKEAKGGEAKEEGLYHFKKNYPLAVNSFESGRYDKVIANLSEILELNKDDEKQILLGDKEKGILFARRGLAYFHLKNFEAAQCDLEVARNLHVNSVSVYHALADIYISQEKFTMAYHMLTEAIEIDKNCAQSYVKRSQVHQALKNTELKEADEKMFQELTEKEKGHEAIIALTRKIEIDKEYFVENFYQRGILYTEAGEFADAKKDFYAASQIDSQYCPAFKEAGISLARQYLKQGKYQEAIEECKSLLKDDKENQEVREIFLYATQKKYALGLKLTQDKTSDTDEGKTEEKTNTPTI